MVSRPHFIRSTALVAFAFSLPGTCMAAYTPPRVFDLLGASDVVAIGRIVAIGERSYKVERALRGQCAPRIEVQRYRDWVCSFRWAPYELGERIVLCADAPKDPTRSVIYRLRSGGCESEWPIRDGVVHCHLVPSSSPHKADGLDAMYPIDLEEFARAVIDYQRLYSLTVKEAEYVTLGGESYYTNVASIVERGRTEGAVYPPFRNRNQPPLTKEAFRRRSALHETLVRGSEKYRKLLLNVESADVEVETEKCNEEQA